MPLNNRSVWLAFNHTDLFGVETAEAVFRSTTGQTSLPHGEFVKP
jgi:hypothetical protein